MDANKRAMLQMFICAALWSIAGIFIKLINLNPFVIAGMRSLFSALTVLAFMGFRREKILFTRNVAISAFFLAATFFAFVAANKLTTAANAIALQYTAPVFILIGSALFLKEKFVRADLCVVIVTLAGIALFFFDQLDAGRLAGNLLGVLSGLLMAGMFLAVRHCDKSERMSGMLMGHLLTAAVGIPFLLLDGNALTLRSLGLLAVLGVFQLGIPYILCGLASEHCPPLACSLIGTVEPLLNPVWVAIFDGETPGPFALAGAAVVIIAITAWCVAKERVLKKMVAHG